MLHTNAYQCNENPAYKAEQNRFAAAFYKAYKLVLRPMAAIAIAIINLPIEGSWASTGRLSPARVLKIAAITK